MIFRVLTKEREQHPDMIVVHGGDMSSIGGADCWATWWARENGVPTLIYNPNWDVYKDVAREFRDQRLVDDGADQCHVFLAGRPQDTLYCLSLIVRAKLPVEVHE